MHASQPIKVKLNGRLTQVKETASATCVSAQPAQQSPPVSLTLPTLDIQELRKDLSELARRAKEIYAQDKSVAAGTAQLSVELGVAIAERLLSAGIAADRQRLDQIVVGVLEKMPAAPSVIVRGHAKDLDLLQIQLAGHADWASQRELLRFHPDETCQRGRFKIEANDWFTEWDTQRCLAELRTALLEEIYAE